MKKTLNDLILTALKNGNYEEADRLFVMMCAYVRRATTSNTNRSQAAKQLVRTAEMGARAYLPTHGDNFYAQEIDGELVITPASKSHNLKQLRNLLVNACPWHASETVEQRYEDLRVEELMAPMISENTRFKLAHGFDMPDIYDFVAVEAEFRQMVAEEIAQAKQTEKVITSSVEDYNETATAKQESEVTKEQAKSTKDVYVATYHGMVAFIGFPNSYSRKKLLTLTLNALNEHYANRGEGHRLETSLSNVCYKVNPQVLATYQDVYDCYGLELGNWVCAEDVDVTIDYTDFLNDLN